MKKNTKENLDLADTPDKGRNILSFCVVRSGILFQLLSVEVINAQRYRK